MKKVLLGGKVEVTQCCLGTMTWGVQNNEADAHAQLDCFVAAGGTLVDTAEMYPVPPSGEVIGRTEEYIGTWLRARPERRRQIVLASKVAGPRPGGWIRANRKAEYAEKANDDTFNSALNREQIFEAIEASLRRLQTDYLDLYQLHWPERYTALFGRSAYEPPADGGHQLVPEKREFGSVEEQVKAMGDLIKQGKVKHWGLSNETSCGVFLFCQAADRLGVPRPVSVQNDFSLVDRRFEAELAETCAHLQVSLLAYGPLAGGYLSGKYTPGFERASVAIESRLSEDSRHRKFPKFQPRYMGTATAAAAVKYCQLARDKGLAPATLALAWCTSRSYIRDTGSVIIGATTVEQLRENMEALAVSLDADILAAIDKVHRENPNPNCDQHLSMV
uniref:NADP-dependent oxidoreductase domain-containing protein n=1 Tax=Zooxanthella nutricula TaxID=1333877 RepID=A0A7S2QCI9_9DINO